MAASFRPGSSAVYVSRRVQLDAGSAHLLPVSRSRAKLVETFPVEFDAGTGAVGRGSEPLLDTERFGDVAFKAKPCAARKLRFGQAASS
jgi:hypothetical protein